MQTSEELIRETEEMLAQPIKLPHQVATIGENLYLLAFVHGLDRDAHVDRLRTEFREAVRSARLEHVLESHLRYAIRLATTTGQLIYEETHKLFSLCDEIHALRKIGFMADYKLIGEFEASVRSRFAAERRQSRLVAEDKLEDWKRSLWWYSENLTSYP